MMQALAPQSSLYVQEWDDQFFALFPHRFDYIYAKHPEPGQSPEWQTESRHPLSDRLLHQGAYLFGVRFGSQTNYCLLDIDRGSFYHPQHDPLAIDRILAALEPLGLVTPIACTSSYSGGIHLYFPFQHAQNSWELASVVGTLLENAGFTLKPGQLEIFPNPKPYAVEGMWSLFNAHRLPMQAGSYLINEEFQPISSYSCHFVQRWNFAQQRNCIDTKILKRILKQARRTYYRISGKADKFINDLNAEIELGWTGFGQTNRLLGRITMRAYIFHHMLTGGDPLNGKALVREIVNMAQALPGYREWCRHQHEIEQRAEEWARCIENSHYFHYGDQKGKYKDKSEESNLARAIEHLPSWNQKQSEGARERIRAAIVDMLEQNSLPSGATARFKKLLQYGIGGGSLYRHRDLWHPNHLVDESSSYLNNQIDNSSCLDNRSNLSADLIDRSSQLETGLNNSLSSFNNSLEEIAEEISVNTSDVGNLSSLPADQLSQDDKNNQYQNHDQDSSLGPTDLENSTSLLSMLGGDSLCGKSSGDHSTQAKHVTGGNSSFHTLSSDFELLVQQVLFDMNALQQRGQPAKLSDFCRYLVTRRGKTRRRNTKD